MSRAAWEPGTTVYTPDSALRRPRALLRAMVADLAASRQLAWRLMVRDISSRYRQAALGILWAFLPPVAAAAIFVVLKREAAVNIPDTGIPYPAFVMIGTVFWQLFVLALNAPIKAVTKNRAMLTRVNFPREALVLAGLGEVFFELLVRVLILAGVFVVFQVPVSWGLVAAPAAVVVLILAGLMIGLLLTPVGVLYTDIAAALPTITGLWFFVTPVVYPPPTRWPYSLLMDLNPAAPLLVGARDLATGQGLTNPGPFAAWTAAALLGLLAMWIVYRLSLPILTERIGA
jgi:lipopolysaccharide transport system permease protein